jgi:hypothetical protein
MKREHESAEPGRGRGQGGKEQRVTILKWLQMSSSQRHTPKTVRVHVQHESDAYQLWGHGPSRRMESSQHSASATRKAKDTDKPSQCWKSEPQLADCLSDLAMVCVVCLSCFSVSVNPRPTEAILHASMPPPTASIPRRANSVPSPPASIRVARYWS